jgi:uncharacterized protein
MDLDLLGLAALGLFAAGVVKGGTGLGYSSCAIPFLVPALGLNAAMVVVLAPAIATNLGVALSAGHFRETCRRFYLFYLATLPGIGCGVLILAFCDQALATRALGIMVLCYAVFALAKPNLVLPQRLAAWLQGPAGFANGIITGLTGSQVMPLLPYMMSLGLEPDRFVQAVNLSVLVSSLVLAAALAFAGAVDPRWFAISLLAILPAMLGIGVGTFCRRYISAEGFRKLVLAVLLATGLMLLCR